MDKKLQKKSNKNKIILFLICLSTLTMSIGYAAMNLISLDIQGIATTTKQEGIFITEVNYISDVSADLNKSKITKIFGNKLNSEIYLSPTDANSSITYQIKIYNSYDADYYFDKVKYLVGKDTYSNQGITFKISGLDSNQKITKKSYVTFNITFSYLNNTLADSNVLTSLLNFQFRNFACPTDGRVCDLSGNNNHGSLNGAIMNASTSTLYTDGIDDYVNCGLVNYNFGNKVSYILRYQVKSWSDTDYWEFFGNWHSAGGGLRINEDKTFGASININNQYQVPKISLAVELNKWYTQIVTYDGNNIIIYINGIKYITKEASGNIKVSPLPILIGGNPELDNGSSNNANLTVDYALLFKRAITENEVSNDYTENVIISNEKDLILYYEFE